VWQLQREARFDEANQKNERLAELKDHEFVLAQKQNQQKLDEERKAFNQQA